MIEIVNQGLRISKASITGHRVIGTHIRLAYYQYHCYYSLSLSAQTGLNRLASIRDAPPRMIVQGIPQRIAESTMTPNRYEWAVVGGGVAGIALAEILTREGHSVILIDKGNKLAGETTKLFHEWMHAGSLYTLVPDKLLTLKFILGAIDDLLEYYSCFPRMNLRPTESGLSIAGATDWFAPNFIEFRYRRRRWNIPWCMIVARSAYLISQIKKHDWLRRRAGILEEFQNHKYETILANLKDIWASDDEFYRIECPDFTTNSSIVLRDLVATAVSNGLELSLGNRVLKVESHDGQMAVVTERATILAANVVICAGENIRDFVDVSVKTSYAPIAVVRGLSREARSFVELDYFVKTCINLVTKPAGIGLIGGISLDSEMAAREYMDYVIARHQALDRGLSVIDTYLGKKNEIVFAGQDRNYLFHIVPTEPRMWAVVPGKFTLGFSLGPEFYRRVYRKNPRKFFKTVTDTGEHSQHVSDTLWLEMVNGERSG